jgi:hypothetical protein
MIVQDDPNRAVGGVPGIEVGQKTGEFEAAMTALDPRCDVPVVQIQRCKDRAGARTFVLVITANG